MRGIGFTVQTTDPQSASCLPAVSYATHTAAGVRVRFVYVLCVWIAETHKFLLLLKRKYCNHFKKVTTLDAI